MDNDYELRYLPLFYEDMFEKVSYIRDELQVITTSELVDRVITTSELVDL